MKIGIDMDDTICNTKELLIEYEKIFCEYNNLDYDSLWYNENNKKNFLNTYLKEIYKSTT